MANKHPHKGPATKRELLKDVPLVQMTEDELDNTFDEIGKDTTKAILQEARIENVQIVIATAILQAPGQPDRLVLYDPEYGDEAGEEHIQHFIDRVARLKLLKPGETLRAETFNLGWPVRK